MNEVNIKKAKIEDMPIIYDMVYQLAVYEKEPEAVKIGIEEYISAFESGLIGGHIASINGDVVGITVYYMTFSTWRGRCLYLEDFFVKPEFRKFGIGQKLFDAYIEEAKILGAKQAKWQVLDWNQPAIDFYEKNGATIEKEWWNGKLFF